MHLHATVPVTKRTVSTAVTVRRTPAPRCIQPQHCVLVLSLDSLETGRRSLLGGRRPPGRPAKGDSDVLSMDRV